MRIIIIGGGEVGYALGKSLGRSHDVFIVDHDPLVGERLSALDVDFILGSGTSAQVLRRARVDRCDWLIACTGLDEVNLVACAVAARLGSPETICFVSKEDFLRVSDDAASLHEHFGVKRILWPEAQLAEEILRIVVAPGAIDAEAFAGGEIRLLEYRLGPGSALLGAAVSDLHLPRRALIAAVKRADQIFIPKGSTVLAPGDKIIVMGTEAAMRTVEQRVAPTAARDPRQLVTIVGGGDVGYRLAQRLDSRFDVTCRVVERDRRRGELLAANLARTLVINGDGTDLEFLEGEGIGASDVLVSVIDNDERNLLASLLARQLGVRKVIARVSRMANLRLFERVGIDVALSARGAAVASVLHQMEGGKSNLLAVLEEGQAQVQEIVVPAGFAAVQLRALEAPAESIVGAIVRDARAIVPRGDDTIEPGDRLLVFSTSASAPRVREYFTAPR